MEAEKGDRFSGLGGEIFCGFSAAVDSPQKILDVPRGGPLVGVVTFRRRRRRGQPTSCVVKLQAENGGSREPPFFKIQCTVTRIADISVLPLFP